MAAQRSARSLAVMGGGLILALTPVAALAFGVGSPGFGRAKVAVTVVGAVVFLRAWLGERTGLAYRNFAVIAMNFVVLLGLAELGAWGVLKLLDRGSRDEAIAQLPRYYDAQPWSRQYQAEISTAQARVLYEPFVVWRRVPFKGRTVNVGLDGRRVTTGAVCVPNAYKVFVFGGSTLWGIGSPDWTTIPSFLQAGLALRRSGPVCVTNFGELGFISTQEVIRLIERLAAGQRPDLVIFYDGVNDVRTASIYGRPNVHFALHEIAARVEDSGGLLGRLRNGSMLARLTTRLAVGPRREDAADYVALGIDADSLARAIVRSYLANYEVVKALAREYGFAYEIFWQPALPGGRKRLSVEEQRSMAAFPPTVARLYRATYDRMVQEAPRHEHLHDLGALFDGDTETVYIDFNHVVPPANRRIAERILAALDSAAR